MNKNLIHRILIVDDDESFLNILSGRLEREGVLVYRSKEGESAKKIAQEKLPDLIVTDIVMPGMNGFDLIRELKCSSKTCNIEFVILSSHGEPRIVYDEEFLNSLGIRKYLIKSNYTPTEIVKEIKKAIIACKTQPLKR